MSTDPIRWFPVPVDGRKVGYIPFPMTEDDFDMMIELLILWRKKLTTPTPTPLPPALPAPQP